MGIPVLSYSQNSQSSQSSQDSRLPRGGWLGALAPGMPVPRLEAGVWSRRETAGPGSVRLSGPGRCPWGLIGGGYLLSHFRSTIGAAGFNFSVRNGKRWNPRAMAALISLKRSLLEA